MTSPPAPDTRSRDSGRGWAYAGLIFGSTSSVAANVGHAFIRPHAAPTGWRVQPGAIAWGVAVAVALLISVEVLARAAWPATRGWRTVRYAGGTTVALVAAGTSYRHLSDLLAHWGETTPVIYGGPAIVDGLMILCSFALMIPNPEPTTPAPTVRAAAPDPVSEPIRSAPDSRPNRIAPHRPPDPSGSRAPSPPAGGQIPVAVPARSAPRSTARAATRPDPARPGNPITARPQDVAALRAALASGDLPPHPSADAIRAHLKISPAYARAARNALLTAEPMPRTRPSPYQNPQEETPEPPQQEHIPATTS